MGSSPVTVATLDIAGDGNFIVLAKMWVVNEVGATTMFCRLDGGNTFDINHLFLAQAGQPGSNGSMSFMIGEFFDPGESATIARNPLGGQIHVFDIKMTAIEAGRGAEEPV